MVIESKGHGFWGGRMTDREFHGAFPSAFSVLTGPTTSAQSISRRVSRLSNPLLRQPVTLHRPCRRPSTPTHPFLHRAGAFLLFSSSPGRRASQRAESAASSPGSAVAGRLTAWRAVAGRARVSSSPARRLAAGSRGGRFPAKHVVASYGTGEESESSSLSCIP